MALGRTTDPLSGATRYNPYAVGKKLYGAGLSNRATAGPVDKQGYRDRELRKQAMARAIQSIGKVG